MIANAYYGFVDAFGRVEDAVVSTIHSAATAVERQWSETNTNATMSRKRFYLRFQVSAEHMVERAVRGVTWNGAAQPFRPFKPPDQSKQGRIRGPFSFAGWPGFP